MIFPVLTLAATAVLTLFFLGLGINVTRHRISTRISLGDGSQNYSMGDEKSAPRLFVSERLSEGVQLTLDGPSAHYLGKVMRVSPGDAVSFKNEDPYVHNIFSLSDTKTFDLGSYPQGQAKKVVFDKPGEVEIECAIHPEMKLTVEVKK